MFVNLLAGRYGEENSVREAVFTRHQLARAAGESASFKERDAICKASRWCGKTTSISSDKRGLFDNLRIFENPLLPCPYLQIL